MSATRLREVFDQRVLGVLPAPVLFTAHSSIVEHAAVVLGRVVRVWHWASGLPSGGRERVIEAVAGSSLAGKIAAGALSVVLLAGGAVGVTRAVGHDHARHPHKPVLQAPRTAPQTVTTTTTRTVRKARRHRHKRPAALRNLHQRVPGNFAYLGAPNTPGTPGTPTARRRSKVPIVTQHGGGPFGP